MNETINHFLLRLVLLPTFIYRKYGVDMRQLTSILQTKLIMDDRRPSSFRRARSNAKETSTATMLTMFICLLMGAMFILAFQVSNDVTRLTIYFGLLMIMLSLFLITDFTSVLIDVKDNYIILPKPVSAATFLSARLLHIIIHLSKIVVPLSLPGLIAMIVNYGIWGGIIFIPIVGLVTLFTIFMVNAAYLLILQVFTPEKFKSIITFVQIGFTILLYASYQLFPRLMDSFGINSFDVSQKAYAWLLPSYWFAGSWKFFYSFSFEPVFIICTLISLIIPFLCIWIVVKYFAPTFQRKLSLISSGSGPASIPDKKSVSTHDGSPSFINWLSNLLTKDSVERASFLFSWKFMVRSREFKMKVYPQFGYMVVLFVLLFFRFNHGSAFSNAGTYATHNVLQVLFTLYLCSFVFMGALYQIPYTESFRASWIYFTSPIDKPGKIISGVVKTSLLQFCVPLLLVISILIVIFKGPVFIPNLLFASANVILLCCLGALILIKQIPFSMPPKNASDGSLASRRIILFLIVPIFGIPHYFIFPYPIIAGALSIVSFALVVLVLNRIRNLTWDKIAVEE